MKNQVLASKFLEWYFSSDSDVENIGMQVVSDLRVFGKVRITAKELFDSCGYIPQFICENADGNDEYDPFDLEFIQD
jgi:hypothetical protein